MTSKTMRVAHLLCGHCGHKMSMVHVDGEVSHHHCMMCGAKYKHHHMTGKVTGCRKLECAYGTFKMPL